MTWKLRAALLAILALLPSAYADFVSAIAPPKQEYTVYLGNTDPQFDVEVNKLDSGLQLWFYAMVNETNGLILTNQIAVVYRWSPERYVTDVGTMSSLTGVVSTDTNTPHLVVFTSTNTTWQSTIRSGFAAVYVKVGSNDYVTLAQGTHTTRDAPEKTASNIPDTAEPLNWANYTTHTNFNTHGPLRAGSTWTAAA
jgi:hypothetical protein